MKDEPAFPVEGLEGPNRYVEHLGLTKREYFAARAMQGLIAGKSYEEAMFKYKKEMKTLIAEDAIKLADALMKALNNPKED